MYDELVIFGIQIELLCTTDGWVEGAADVREELGANSSAQCIGHRAQHMPLIRTKYRTFVPKWRILYALLSDIRRNISQIRPHLYRTSHPIVRGPALSSTLSTPISTVLRHEWQLCTHFTGYFGGEFKKKEVKKGKIVVTDVQASTAACIWVILLLILSNTLHKLCSTVVVPPEFAVWVLL